MHVDKLAAVSIFVLSFLPCIGGSKKSACEAPPIEEGKAGVITCKFEEHVTRLKSFSLDFIPVNGSDVDLVTLVSCIGTDKNPTCKNTSDFNFGEPVNTIINVTITYSDIKHTGRYICTVMESEPGDNQPCDFVVQGLPARPREWDDTPNTNYSMDTTGETDTTSNLEIAYTIIAIVVLIVASSVFVALILIKRKYYADRVLCCAKPVSTTTSPVTSSIPVVPIEVDGNSNDALLPKS